MQKDHLLRALAHDTGIQISAALTTGMAERARQIHQTEPTATAALGRALTITSIMGSQLKTPDGSVTVQVKGNGPLGTIVCVSDAEGYARGYVQNSATELPIREDGKLDVGGAVGRGYVMVIKDIGLREPVTGTVALVNGEIAEDMTRYFAESEQIPSACALGVLVDTDRSVKCSGGFLVQLMPGVRDQDIDRLEKNLSVLPPVTTLLQEGNTLQEITKKVLDGFQVDFLEDTPVGYRCTCSREKVCRALISLGRKELEAMAEEKAEHEITCQFCDTVYRFSTEELRRLLEQAQS